MNETEARLKEKESEAEAEVIGSHYFSRNAGAAEGPADGTSPEAVRGRRPVTVRAAGQTLKMSSGAGVFARAGFDAGSRLLVDCFAAANSKSVGAPGATDRLLDLGCGWGPVGCALAARYPEALVGLCDINGHAAQLAAENARANGLGNALVWCGDGASAARAGAFSAVICNPPVRAGNFVIARLFEEARRCLRPGGELWIVLRTAQGAKSWARRLESEWGNCETVAIEAGYRTMRIIKRGL